MEYKIKNIYVRHGDIIDVPMGSLGFKIHRSVNGSTSAAWAEPLRDQDLIMAVGDPDVV